MQESPMVVVVDDDREVRASLAALVQSIGLDVACYATGREFLEGYSPSRPGCVVLDLRLPQVSGLEVFHAMGARGMSVPVIMISGHGDIKAAVAAMKGGAVDFLEKPYRGAALLESIRRAIDVDARRREAQAGHEQLRVRFESLTPQEHDVLRLTMAGKPDKSIAVRLDMSMRTVQMRRSSVMRKMEAHSRIELIRLVQKVQDGLR